VSRNSDGKLRRSLSNEAEVVAALRRAAAPHYCAVEVFHGSRHSLRSSMALFRRARAIVGVHGAGLTNMIFAAPGTAVVEMVSLHPSHRMFMHLAAALDLPYWVVAAGMPSNIFESEFAAPAEDAALALEAALAEAAGGGTAERGQSAAVK